jgi:hypothetical protein
VTEREKKALKGNIRVEAGNVDEREDGDEADDDAV